MERSEGAYVPRMAKEAAERKKNETAAKAAAAATAANPEAFEEETASDVQETQFVLVETEKETPLAAAPAKVEEAEVPDNWEQEAEEEALREEEEKEAEREKQDEEETKEEAEFGGDHRMAERYVDDFLISIHVAQEAKAEKDRLKHGASVVFSEVWVNNTSIGQEFRKRHNGLDKESYNSCIESALTARWIERKPDVIHMDLRLTQSGLNKHAKMLLSRTNRANDGDSGCYVHDGSINQNDKAQQLQRGAASQPHRTQDAVETPQPEAGPQQLASSRQEVDPGRSLDPLQRRDASRGSGSSRSVAGMDEGGAEREERGAERADRGAKKYWYEWCLQFFGEAADEVQGKLSKQGYTSVDQLKQSMRSRSDWINFCHRTGIPDRYIQMSAPEFGPNLPSAALQMDRHDRLAAELSAWYGEDFDLWATFRNPKDIYGSETGRCAFNFFNHDTTKEQASQILQDGIIRPHQANDTHYDGHLAHGMAPSVVFFQASEFGGDPSVYPRITDQARCRFLMSPSHLALHTDAFRMYHVSVTPPRLNESKMIQLHVLLISKDHPSTAWCDEHLMQVNKHTYQPFFYNKWKGGGYKWQGFNYQHSKSQAFQGRGVKVNVAVAQYIPMWYGNAINTNSLDSLHDVNMRGFGVITPTKFPLAICSDWAIRGKCGRGDSCTFSHDYGGDSLGRSGQQQNAMDIVAHPSPPLRLPDSSSSVDVLDGQDGSLQELRDLVATHKLHGVKVSTQRNSDNGLYVDKWPVDVGTDVFEKMLTLTGKKTDVPFYRKPTQSWSTVSVILMTMASSGDASHVQRLFDSACSPGQSK